MLEGKIHFADNCGKVDGKGRLPARSC